MQSIEVYLKRFENFGLKEKLVTEKVISVVQKVCNIDLKEEEISYTNGILRIDVSGPRKTEIFMYRKEIQKEVEGALDVR